MDQRVQLAFRMRQVGLQVPVDVEVPARMPGFLPAELAEVREGIDAGCRNVRIFAKVVGAVEQVAGIPPLERARFEVMNERIHAQARDIRITPQIVGPVEDPGRLDRVEPRTRSGDAEPVPEAPDGPHDSTNWRL